MQTLTRILEPRDLEILRALLRLRYLPTRLINAAFFTHERIGRRRLQKLAGRGLIRLHRKGQLPLDSGAWRLMSGGLHVIEDAFPNEPIPKNLVERVTEGSLLNLEEREDGSQVYLDLIVPKLQLFPEGSKVMQCRRWAHEVRRRASAITWSPKNDVVLRYEFLGKYHQVVPDATVTSPRRKLRVFVTLDRPTKRREWAGTMFGHYNTFLGLKGPVDQGFSDGHTPCFLFVTHNLHRAQAISTVLQHVEYQRMRWYVVSYDAAAHWLGRALLDREENAQQERRSA